jgi:hypothetical protein
MADPKSSSDPSDQEHLVERGLGGGRPSGGGTVTPERAGDEERSGVESVQGVREPRTMQDRSAEGPDDPVLPADDSSLNTKI